MSIVAKSKVAVNGYELTLKFISKPRHWWPEGTTGEYIPKEKSIYILANLPPRVALKTLTHEVYHVILYKWRNEYLNPEVQEAITRELTRVCSSIRKIGDEWIASKAETIGELFQK